MTQIQPVLIAGNWQASNSSGAFQAENPAKQELLPDLYPVSKWEDCDAALTAAAVAAQQMRELPSTQLAEFLEAFAGLIEAHAAELVEIAHLETAYPKSPRLADVELPRTTNQLRQAAAAAREGSWSSPVIDSQANIRSFLAPIGPVCVFGPNNFPFAFGSASGGDFAAAIAAGCPVIAKANSSHPGTTRLFATLAQEAVLKTKMPAGTVQLLYRTSHADGERLVSDPRIGATGYTGSRQAGLKLKVAADSAGKPIYLELSSTNPVIILPGALAERRAEIVDQFCISALMGTGQFCTNPGLVILIENQDANTFITDIAAKFQSAVGGTLLSKATQKGLDAAVEKLLGAGAQLVTTGQSGGGYSCGNRLLRVGGQQFLEDPETLQTEAFGNASLFVVAANIKEAANICQRLEGNLTGCIYSDTHGADDDNYQQLAPALRSRVGRLLNNKMPTGVAVSAAMNHGGPFPSTGHPGFTAVGIPASLKRFGMLQCFDNVREDRLPAILRNKNLTGKTWRWIDGGYTQGDVTA